MKQFDWEKFKESDKIGVLCKSKEEADNFCNEMDREGLKWGSGTSYKNNSKFFIMSGQEGMIYFSKGTWGCPKDYSEKDGYEIWNWSEYMAEKSGNKEPFTRQGCLEQAISIVCKDRESQYGDPEDNFKTIAGLWSEYKGCEFTSTDVAVMMALLKIARIKGGKHKEDNFIDLAGYAACAGELSAKEAMMGGNTDDDI